MRRFTLSQAATVEASHRPGRRLLSALLAACVTLTSVSPAVAGGYVDGNTVLLPATAINTGAITVTPTFNNDQFNDRLLVGTVNNDPVRTPSTADPVVETRACMAKLPESLCRVVGFGLAKRLLPGYEGFSKKYELESKLDVLVAAMASIHSWLNSSVIDADAVSRLLKEVEKITPETEDYDDILVSFALDSAVSVLLSLKSLIETPAEFVNDISTLSTDSADRVVREVMGVTQFNPGVEKDILDHPVMKREVEAQRSILDIAVQSKSLEEAVKRVSDYASKNQGSVALQS